MLDHKNADVERVDTPALQIMLVPDVSETDKPADRAAVVQERPMELDRAQAKKECDVTESVILGGRYRGVTVRV